MKRYNVKTSNALKTVHSIAEILRVRHLQNGKVVANGPRAIPNKVMYSSKFRCVRDNFVEQVIASLTQDLRSTKVRWQLFLDSSGCSSKLLDHLCFHCWRIFRVDSRLTQILCRGQRGSSSLDCPPYTHLLFNPNIVLCPALHPLKLRAHISACCSWCQSLRESARPVRIGDYSIGDCIGALTLAVDFEL
jgi:hypothetical protein